MQMRQPTQEDEEKVKANKGLVHYIANKYSSSSDQFDDYVQIGMFALYKAVMTFDEGKGNTFATYATRVIENEILMDIRRNKKHQRVLSLDDTKVVYVVEGTESTLQDVIADTSTLPVEENGEYEEQIEKTLSIILNRLNSKYKVALLFDISGMLQSKIGEKLNMSQSYVSRVLKRARKELMRQLSLELTFGMSSFFSVVVESHKIKILFSCVLIENAKQRIIEFLDLNEELRRRAGGEITILKEKVMIELDMEAEALEFLAEFFYYFGL